jgi:hypothetical protein
MRTRLSMLLTGLLLPCLASAATLVRDGQPQATLIVARDAGAPVQLAASELQRYIEAISGAKLPIGTEGEAVSGFPVHVGRTSATAALIPGEPEGILIRNDDKRLIICGGSDRATLFAAYRFLEQALGCRWLSREIDYVPGAKTVEVRSLSIASAPSFSMRTFIARTDDRQAWGMKLGLNGQYDAKHAAISGNCFYLPQAIQGCHAYHQIIPTDQYFDAHPEWFPLVGGQRYRSNGTHGQLCVTAPGLADEFARRVIAVFDADPNLPMTSISPNDGYGWCECEQCLALDQKLNGARTTKQGLAEEKPFMGDRVFWFANQVAERVAKVHPDKLLLVLAYVNYAEPPDTIKPAPNVVPWLCHYAPADYSRPINDPTSAANAQFNDLMRRWAKIAPHLLMYSYVSKSMWWRLPRPVTRNFAADLKYEYSLGLRRYYCQSGLSDWALDGPLYYVLAKLMWDVQADPEALAQDWITHMFGAAAPQMTEYYNAVERSVRKTGQSYSESPSRQVPGLYDQAELAAAQQHLDAALKAPTSEQEHARIEEVAKVFQYGVHMVRAIEAGERFRAELTAATLKEARDEGALALGFAQVREAQEYLDRFRYFDALGVLGNGFGTAEQLGGRICWNTDETGLGDGKAGWADFLIETADTTKGLIIEMDVWGKSQLENIVINSDGTGKGYSQGGVWNPVAADQKLSGEEKWQTLTFRLAPELLAAGKRTQRLGLGGGDSQIWLGKIRVRPGQ